MIPRLPLCDRLRLMRRSTLAQLAAADRIDAELLRLANDVAGALAALDAEAREAIAPAACDRAIVLAENLQIRVRVYSADGRPAAAKILPVAAIRLGNQLIAAGGRRL